MEPYGFYLAYTKAVDHLDEVNPDAFFAFLAETEDMSFSDAEEYAKSNIYNQYIGPNTPIFVDEVYNPAPTVLPPPITAEDMYEL